MDEFGGMVDWDSFGTGFYYDRAGRFGDNGII